MFGRCVREVCWGRCVREMCLGVCWGGVLGEVC